MSVEATPSSRVNSEVSRELAGAEHSGCEPNGEVSGIQLSHAALEPDNPVNVQETTLSAAVEAGAVRAHSLCFQQQRAANTVPFQKADRLGRYRIVKLLGGGGMAWAFLAERVTDGCMVVLKVRKPAADQRRFVREPGDTPKHENVIEVYEEGCERGWMFYAMEYAAGKDLANQTNQFRGKPKLIARLIAQVCRAIAYAHAYGIIHRDLKPGNILLTHDGTAKVADFGLAKRLDPPCSPTPTSLTPSGIVVGTLPYMSPEQLRGDRPLPTATDVWSIGVIIYQLLTNRLPFPGKTLGEVAASQRKQLILPREIDPAVPYELEWICLQCLQSNSDDRPSAELVAGVLDKFVAGEIHERVPPNTLRARASRWVRKNHLWVTTYLAVLAAVGTAIGMLSAAYERAQREAAAEKQQLQDAAIHRNELFATQVAGNVLFQLDQYSAAVVEVAEDPAFLAAWKTGDTKEIQARLEEVFNRYNRDLRMGLAVNRTAPTFASFYVVRPNGDMVVRTPRRPEAIAVRHFPDRDYLLGATRHSHTGRRGRSAVHISRVFESKNDGLFKFAISVPLYSGQPSNPVFEGAVVATLTTDSTLGLVSLADATRKVALVAPLDPGTRAGLQTPDRPASEYVVFVHPAYTPGFPPTRFPIHTEWLPRSDDGPELRLVQTPHSIPADAVYTDPVSSDPTVGREYGGRWLAGFAQVGNTELMVVVQERYEDTVGESYQLSYGTVLLAAFGVAMTVFVVTLIGTWWGGKIRAIFSFLSSRRAAVG